MPLVPGQTAEVQRVVTHDLTADERTAAKGRGPARAS